MTTSSKTLLAVIATALLSVAQAHATAAPIAAGSQIDFGVGTITYDTQSLATASEVMTWTNAQVTLATGSFASIPTGTAATLAQPWVFVPSTATPGLWSVTFGGNTFSFDLASDTVFSPRSTQFLNVSGPGTIHGTGFLDTPGEWSFTSTNANGQDRTSFTFTTDTTANGVPDGGATVALLGLGLAGLEGLRRLLRPSPRKS